MDPKNLPLDPKLKEAYDRVMGTSLSNPAPIANTIPVASPISTPPPTPSFTPQAMQPTQSVPVPTPPVNNSSTSTFVATSANHGVSKPSISPVLLIVAGVIFFAVYTIFWLRYFNIPLPFLP